MPISPKKPLQNWFSLIRSLQLNRTKYRYLQTFITLFDYLIITLIHLYSAIAQTYPLATSAQQTAARIQHLQTAINYLHFTILFVFLSANAILIFRPQNTHLHLKTFKQLQQFSIQTVKLSSWLYQATLLPFYSLLNLSIQTITSPSSIPILINIVASFSYVFLFQKRKIYGVCLPGVFLARLLLEANVAAVVIVSVSAYFWKESQTKIEKIIYINILLLEITQLVNRISGTGVGVGVTYANTLRLLLILALVSLIHVLSYKDLTGRKGQSVIKEHEAIIQLIQNIRNKSYKETIEDIITVEAFYLGNICPKNGESLEQRLIQSLKNKLRTELENDPCNITKQMTSIRLQTLEGANRLQILKELQKLNLLSENECFRIRYAIYSFVDQTIAELNLQSQVNLQEIIAKDVLQQKSQGQILEFVRAVIDYWQYIEGDSLSEEKIIEGLQTISHKEEKIVKIIEHYQQHNPMSSNLLVCQFALKCLYPQNEIKPPSKQGNTEENSLLREQGSSYFILIEGSRIKTVSCGLARRLGFDLQLTNDIPILQLFPKYAYNFQQVFCGNLRRQSLILPVLNCQGEIHPFNSTIQVIPSFQGHICYFLQLRELSNQVYPYLIINNTQSTIELTSANFHKYFDGLSAKRQLCLQELFGKTWKNFEQSRLDLEIKIDSRRTKVKLQKLRTYMEDGNEYLLLRLAINKKIVSTTRAKIFIQRSMDSTSFKKYELYDRETFFCRIPHPYENKYNQNLARLNDNSRQRSTHKLAQVFAVIVFIFIANLVVAKVMTSVTSKDYLAKILQLEKVNEAKSSLLHLFQKDYQLFQMRTNNITFGSIYTGNTTMVQELYTQIDELVDELQRFRFSYHQEMTNLPFSLQFRGFKVDGQIIDTNIVDILQSSKQFLKDNDLFFITNNFDFIEVFNKAYDICPILSQKIRVENQPIFYLMLSSLLLMGIILIPVYYTLKNVVETGQLLMKITMNSKKEILDKTLQCLLHFQSFVTQNQELYLEEQGDESEGKSKSRAQFVNLLRQEEKASSRRKTQMKQIIEKEDQVIKTQLGIKGSNKGNEQQATMLYSYYRKQTHITHPLLAYFRQSYLLTILMIMGLYFARVYLSAKEYSFDKTLALSYFDEYFQSERSIIGLYAEMYEQIMQDYYSIDNRAGRKNFLDMKFANEGNLPSFFQPFIKRQQVYITSNLCSQHSSIYQFNTSLCSAVLGGVLERGVGVAFALYFEAVQSTVVALDSKDGEDDLGEIWLMQMLLMENIERIREEYEEEMEKYILQSDRSLIYWSIPEQLSLLGVVVAIFVVWLSKVRRRCELMVKCFKMLPKDYVLNNRLLKYFNKNQVFEKIIRI